MAGSKGKRYDFDPPRVRVRPEEREPHCLHDECTNETAAWDPWYCKDHADLYKAAWREQRRLRMTGKIA